ncbi:MAG: Ldh family oxidoreductase [Thermoproteota archaeon]|nr:Ldh family oxidoreductase [Thermoproteota archaeon]
MPIFSSQQLHRVGLAIFECAGVSRKEAEQVMSLLVESNLAGHGSHGVIRIPRYVDEILKGITKPDTKIKIVKETPTTAVVDGNWGLGQVVARQTMNIAIEKAEKNNVGVVATFNCGHIGRMADYALMATFHEMIGYCVVNSRPQVVPFGGTQRMFNQSPICWAIPAGKEPPFVLDISTSVSAGGKIAVAHDKGEKLPPGYIVNKNGNPTLDPEDYYKGGAGLPLGGLVGYKGTGLAMVVDITAGILSGRGAAYLGENRGQGVFQMALKISAFRDLGEFKDEMDNLLRAVRNSKPAPGFKEVLVPGDLELRTRKKRLMDGIDVPQATWDEIVQTAMKVKVDVDKYLD